MSEEKLLKATHEGKLPIGETILNCAVLENGIRVISQTSIFKAFGRTKRGRAKNEVRVPNMPAFLDAKNLQPFVGEDLKGVLKQIDYQEKNGKEDSGYNALILPLLCKVYLDARAAKNPETGKLILTKSQEPLARASEILLIGLSKIGIIALIDEATGYQYDREKLELQAILKALISDEILQWQQAFHLNFYKEIFRLWNVPFTEQNIKRKPQFIGKLTNELVYKNMPKGIFVLDRLKKQTPKTKGGNYKYRLHQSLTPEVGREALKKVIYSIETLAAISDNKNKFKRLVQDRYGQREIPFAEFDVLEKQKPEKSNVKLSDFDKTLKGLLRVPPPKKDN